MNKLNWKILGLGLTVVLMVTSWTLAQTKSEAAGKATPAPAPDLEKGKKLYETNCASCHGIDGRGIGPVAVALKTKPTDLTQIAKKNQGKFDEIHVLAFIDGEKTVSAHGTREMPVWGTRFRRLKGQTESSLNVFSLMKYIESIQEK